LISKDDIQEMRFKVVRTMVVQLSGKKALPEEGKFIEF